MGPNEVLEIVRGAIIVTLKLGAPVMLIGLSVGLAISLVQALTQIQEMTLAFIPKILVIFLSLLLLGPYMLSTLTVFTNQLATRIVSGGG
ncbi:MAG: flagellar biosynthesis protein FliQ [Alphaproteobacteria bacterium]|nr:flagellar biosynthesis protein FliQ [Alphaproteobacteria bacterium]MCZ6494574.1 flagellar biosynthesis protein FliQ [Alphaproteobacteria bacterium]MCZ6608561.1 flagellar biosynthesis protein FliQ [Alphaproteobacteria bacterium]MCZ6741947.1 flagellar biosynthesis protein FliQ [Alphaproteobacteria bacterium]MCZ6849678.1 flagellar biosynthesis protein FliQ [Alphaproteobacteria bacterium]